MYRSRPCAGAYTAAGLPSPTRATLPGLITWVEDYNRQVRYNGLPDYRKVTAVNELACVKSLAKCPPSARMSADVGPYEPICAKATAVLKGFLKLAPRIHPDDDSIAVPVLWHHCLDSKNIFVDPGNQHRPHALLTGRPRTSRLCSSTPGTHISFILTGQG